MKQLVLFTLVMLSAAITSHAAGKQAKACDVTAVTDDVIRSENKTISATGGMLIDLKATQPFTDADSGAYASVAYTMRPAVPGRFFGVQFPVMNDEKVLVVVYEKSTCKIIYQAWGAFDRAIKDEPKR